MRYFLSVVSSTLLWATTTTSSFLLFRSLNVPLAQMNVYHFVLCGLEMEFEVCVVVYAFGYKFYYFYYFMCVCVRFSCISRAHAICVKCSLSLGIPIKLCLCIVRTYGIICAANIRHVTKLTRGRLCASTIFVSHLHNYRPDAE